MSFKERLLYTALWVVYVLVALVVIGFAFSIGHNIVRPLMLSTTLAGFVPLYADIVSYGSTIIGGVILVLYNFPDSLITRRRKNIEKKKKKVGKK